MSEEAMPASSRTDLLLARAEPISNSGWVIIYSRRGENLPSSHCSWGDEWEHMRETLMLEKFVQDCVLGEGPCAGAGEKSEEWSPWRKGTAEADVSVSSTSWGVLLMFPHAYPEVTKSLFKILSFRCYILSHRCLTKNTGFTFLYFIFLSCIQCKVP